MNLRPDNRLELLFADAMALDPIQRDDFLRELDCAEPEVARDLRRFVVAFESSPGFLEQPPSLPVEELLTSAPKDAKGPDLPLPADRIGGYRLVRRLGAGGMGVVYEAEQEKPRRRVALKLVRALSASRSTIARFEAEAEALARLRHPGIAQIFEVGHARLGDEDVPFLVMELVPGARNVVGYAAEEALSQDRRLELFLDVCDAVQHAHASGVVHRDLKPANLLVGSDQRVKVIDFGIARIHEEEPASSARTRTGGLLGTVTYMSPEQLSGRPSQVDARSDVYALGVVLYELLCEDGPYDLEDASLPQVLRIIAEQQPVAPSRRSSAVKGDLETILLKALAKRREDRYASVTDLADDIRRYLRRTPILARRAGMLHRARLFSRRKPGLIAAIVALAFLLLVGGAVVATLWSRAERSREAEREHREAVRLARAELDELRRSLGDDGPSGELSRDSVGLLEPMISGLVESVRQSLTGASSDEERARLLGVAIETLTRLETTARWDPELLEEIAGTYVDLGDLYGGDWLDGPDKVIGAVRAYRRGSELYAALVKRNPSEPRLALGEVRALTNLSQSLRKQNRFEDARAAAQTGVEISETLLANYPGEPAPIQRMIEALWARGDAVIELDQPDAGLADSRRSVELAERLRESSPDSRWTYQTLAWSYFRVAIWLDAQFGDVTASLPNQVEATDAGLDLIRRFPDDSVGLVHLLWNQRREVDARLRIDRDADVIPRIGAIQTAARDAMTLEEVDSHVLRTLHLTHAGMADQLAGLDRRDDALSLLRDVESWFLTLAARDEAKDAIESVPEETRAQIVRIESGDS